MPFLRTEKGIPSTPRASVAFIPLMTLAIFPAPAKEKENGTDNLGHDDKGAARWKGLPGVFLFSQCKSRFIASLSQGLRKTLYFETLRMRLSYSSSVLAREKLF
ncbi:Hypothetical protein FKW44_002681 [Caligus rogercresseyi]|uniref:Uncharacterized protein n=1 Tax=Caligus rogercresseyi TaxID=217165 RepID=A0A7T8KKJ5_CALRO|nr:Hypothetical protein FKW44_002681 [Caligus rogercresseyi]